MVKNSKLNHFISVLLPVYNTADFLAVAIGSILNQTCQNFELIIIDDGSTDNSSKIIRSYKKANPKKIKILRLPQRQGAYNAINYGMKFAKGEFIALMDADDISMPDRLAVQTNFLIKNPDVIVVGTHALLIDSLGKIIGNKTFPQNHAEIYKKFVEVNPLVHPSCMIRRKMLPDRNKPYHCKYGVNDDYYTFFTLLNRGRFANIPKFLFKYRLHLKNSSLIHIKKTLINTIKIRLKAIVDHGYKPTFTGFTKMILQILVAIMLPEKIILHAYLYHKGVIEIPNPIVLVKNKLSILSLKLRYIIPLASR